MMRSVFAILVALLLLAGPAAAERIPLGDISRYLNTFRTAKGAFTQINSDGSLSTGTIYLHRPGRARFDYDPPEETLVVVGGGTVAVFDGMGDGTPEQYPLAKTPLNIILDRQVDLARSGMVVGHAEEGPATAVTARDPQRPEIGSIKLVFTSDPIELRQWVLTDDTGAQTTVILGALETGLRLGANLFNITSEAQRRSGN